MCGIVGVMDATEMINRADLTDTLQRMADTMVHRGPDDSGVWVDEQVPFGLGHRRLAIIDLSQEGRQPMCSAGERYVLVFNGEIYNHREIRADLLSCGVSFRGHSDTEVLLTAIEQWGLTRALGRAVGMFAFALWDRRERVLNLVRDRIGEKPLYYGWLNGQFVFASDLRSLREYPQFSLQVNRHTVAMYLRHNYVPAPYSIYQGVYKLTPGSRLSVPFHSTPDSCRPVLYWSAHEVAKRGVNRIYDKSEDEWIAELDELLLRSVREQMEVDVPYGAFFSGGVDSSTVVAIMQAHSKRRIKTFTIGFQQSEHNEAEHARKVVDYLGTDHTELYLTDRQITDLVPIIPTLSDEPFSAPSMLPTYLVSKLARQHVTVSLSGDGGDELFGGYVRHLWGSDIWHRMHWIPRGVRRYLARGMRQLMPRQTTPTHGAGVANYLADHFQLSLPLDKVEKLADVMAAHTFEQMYYELVSRWKDPCSVVPGAQELPTRFTMPIEWLETDNLSAKMMFMDLVTYLPDNILTKVDRASMSVSLESRAPLLDHRVVEFAWNLPNTLKIRHRQGKWILRQVLYKYVPKELVERPKAGFSAPIDVWLRGPLREWSEDLLNEHTLSEDDLFEPSIIRRKWDQHLQGTHNWTYELWTVLMFQAWRASTKWW